ncbi:RWD domain-containing protein 4 isoform X2 [Cylas formicarius]|uniref:RWD domain-containing protein 4 isoform X2 n=1 Tax=Cylas formicarius TaxID=197179 RepID=UPI002958D900|nr:RWD domain-containing protein 4 isoform X2 [Cylas formicarius]
MDEIEIVQQEEREVLASIYEGDKCFKQIAQNTFQYKYGVSDTVKSFLLEIKWGETYPEELPQISMELFYNKHVLPSIKDKVVNLVKTEAQQFLGMSMTYSLFEFVKEKFEELIKDQPDNINEIEVEKLHILDQEPSQSAKKEKKEQLTKAQKRRQWNRMDGKGEKPRGWDWVDVIKHLSQTGSKIDNLPVT